MTPGRARHHVQTDLDHILLGENEAHLALLVNNDKAHLFTLRRESQTGG